MTIAPTTSAASSLTDWLNRHWLLLFNIVVGVWVLLPWLAPVLMAIGFEPGARLIYKVYTFFCHQLPQRSYFLFGPKLMVPLDEITAVWPYTDFFRLRQFIGAPEMGYKVAWSDRMVSFYTPLFLGGLLMAMTRWLRQRRLGLATVASGWKPLSIIWFILALTPIAIDGVTHTISDALSFGGGFRDTNLWLAELTNFAFAPTFYAGDALGSFNWWMRLLTGLLGGFAIIWFTLPYLEERRKHEYQFEMGAGFVVDFNVNCYCLRSFLIPFRQERNRRSDSFRYR